MTIRTFKHVSAHYRDCTWTLDETHGIVRRYEKRQTDELDEVVIESSLSPAQVDEVVANGAWIETTKGLSSAVIGEVGTDMPSNLEDAW